MALIFSEVRFVKHGLQDRHCVGILRRCGDCCSALRASTLWSYAVIELPEEEFRDALQEVVGVYLKLVVSAEHDLY